MAGAPRSPKRENELTEDDLVSDARGAVRLRLRRADEAAVRNRRPEHRMLAMRHSDDWHRDGCDLADPRLPQERAELVAAYTALLTAVRRP